MPSEEERKYGHSFVYVSFFLKPFVTKYLAIYGWTGPITDSGYENCCSISKLWSLGVSCLMHCQTHKLLVYSSHFGLVYKFMSVSVSHCSLKNFLMIR